MGLHGEDGPLPHLLGGCQHGRDGQCRGCRTDRRGHLGTNVCGWQFGAAGVRARHSVREARVRGRHPKLGGLLLALVDDPMTTKVWAQGAEGERAVGERLDRLPDAIVLHDRKTRRPDGRVTQANIGHIAAHPQEFESSMPRPTKADSRCAVAAASPRPPSSNSASTDATRAASSTASPARSKPSPQPSRWAGQRHVGGDRSSNPLPDRQLTSRSVVPTRAGNDRQRAGRVPDGQRAGLQDANSMVGTWVA